MFRAPVQAISFVEHPILDLKVKESGLFDIITRDESPSDFLENGKFCMQQYCSCLLHKLFSLAKIQIRPFIAYQHGLVSDPVTWLYTLEDLIMQNYELLSSKELNLKAERILIIIELIVQGIENQKPRPSERFNFDKVKAKLKTFRTAEEQLIYLHDIKAEYLQNRPRYLDPSEIPFDEKVEIEIERIGSLLASLEVVKAKFPQKNKLSEPYIDNQEFLLMMKISKRTALTWRETGVIAFSQVGNKVYYKIADVEKLLQSNYMRSFKK